MSVGKLRGLLAGTGALAGLAMMAPVAAHAQAQTAGTRFGVEAAYGDNSIGFGLGAFVKFHLADMSGHPITGRATFDYFFPGTGGYDCSDCGVSFHYWELNADGLYDISSKGNIKPYVGAGLTYAHSSVSYNDTYCNEFECGSLSNSDFGLNILGGLNFMANSKLMPFVEAKYELRSGGEFLLVGGVHF
jgi:opacity protein-like surface antigen